VWEALQRHELYIQKCRECGDTRYYPRALCTHCMSANSEWGKMIGGRGKVYTFTATYQNQTPGFRESFPTSWRMSNWTRASNMLSYLVALGRTPETGSNRYAREVVYEDVTPEVDPREISPGDGEGVYLLQEKDTW